MASGLNAAIVLSILLFVAFSIPIVGALWRIFSIKESLNSALKDLNSKVELNKEKIDGVFDRQTLAFNQLREVVEHTRTRTSIESDKLEDRIQDVESYLEKTTSFSRRK